MSLSSASRGWSRRSGMQAPCLRPNGVSTNGAAAKVVFVLTDWLTGVPKKTLCQKQ